MRFPLLFVATAAVACGHPASGPVGPLPPAPVDAAPPAPAITPIDAAHLEQQLTPYIESLGAKLGERRKLSGFVLVAQQGKPIYARAFGYADREHQTPADADTSFRVGSVTKQFTAAAILALQQDGKLSVDDPIGKYLGDYPAVGKDITLHQLLTHTSGLPDYTELPAYAGIRDKAQTPAQLITMFWDQPLVFAPGTQFAYSNSNYVVLGAIIETVSGQSYADFLAKRLFGPAGMTRTMVGDADGTTNRALGYQPGGAGLVPADPIDMSVPFAAGAVRSTAADLVRWDQALAGDAILDAKSKARYYQPAKDDYAYGWLVKQQDGHTIIGHDGGIEGFESMYLRVPDQQLVVVVWSNNTGVHPQPIAEVALNVALGGSVQPIVEPDVVPLDEALAAREVGHYKLTDEGRAAAQAAGITPDVLATIATAELTRDGDHLVLQPAGQEPLPLDALSPTKFLQIDVDATVELTVPATGPATAMTLTQGQVVLGYVRDDPKPPAPPKKKPHR
jgi:CubicO group peptidase (beta-lactamase class C family)